MSTPHDRSTERGSPGGVPQEPELREHDRQSWKRLVSVRVGGTSLVGETLNLSNGGAMLLLGKQPSPGQRVELHFMTREQETVWVVHAVTRWVTPHGDSLWRFGVEFDEELTLDQLVDLLAG